MLANSTKYALKALVHLAQQPSGEYMQVKTLSGLAHVPGPYFSKIIKQLAGKRIVETRRGSQGGVRLPADRDISFYDVCVALDDPIVVQGCFMDNKECSSGNPCLMHNRWAKIKREVAKFLEELKIQ